MAEEQSSGATQRIEWGPQHLPAGFDPDAQSAVVAQTLNAAVANTVAMNTAGTVNQLGPQPMYPQVGPETQPASSNQVEFGGWLTKPSPTLYGTPRPAISAAPEISEADVPARIELTSQNDAPTNRGESATIIGRASINQPMTLKQITASGQSIVEVPQPQSRVYVGRHWKLTEKQRSERGVRTALAAGVAATATVLTLGTHSTEIVNRTRSMATQVTNIIGSILPGIS